MATPSLFPLFLKAASGLTSLTVLGSTIETLIQSELTVEAEGDMEVSYELESPVIVVEVVGINVETCDG